MFYSRVIRQTVKSGVLSSTQHTLVVCGGMADRDALRPAGLESVTISNLDRRTADDCTPYRWDFQDAERLTYADKSFDIAIVSAGLHHCHSSHRALLEMYRMARKAVLVIEARDNLLIRTAVKLGFTVDYELEAVSDEGFETGGIANGSVRTLFTDGLNGKCLRPSRVLPRSINLISSPLRAADSL